MLGGPAQPYAAGAGRGHRLAGAGSDEAALVLGDGRPDVPPWYECDPPCGTGRPAPPTPRFEVGVPVLSR